MGGGIDIAKLNSLVREKYAKYKPKDPNASLVTGERDTELKRTIWDRWCEDSYIKRRLMNDPWFQKKTGMLGVPRQFWQWNEYQGYLTNNWDVPDWFSIINATHIDFHPVDPFHTGIVELTLMKNVPAVWGSDTLVWKTAFRVTQLWERGVNHRSVNFGPNQLGYDPQWKGLQGEDFDRTSPDKFYWAESDDWSDDWDDWQIPRDDYEPMMNFNGLPNDLGVPQHFDWTWNYTLHHNNNLFDALVGFDDTGIGEAEFSWDAPFKMNFLTGEEWSTLFDPHNWMEEFFAPFTWLFQLPQLQFDWELDVDDYLSRWEWDYRLTMIQDEWQIAVHFGEIAYDEMYPTLFNVEYTQNVKDNLVVGIDWTIGWNSFFSMITYGFCFWSNADYSIPGSPEWNLAAAITPDLLNVDLCFSRLLWFPNLRTDIKTGHTEPRHGLRVWTDFSMRSDPNTGQSASASSIAAMYEGRSGRYYTWHFDSYGVLKLFYESWWFHLMDFLGYIAIDMKTFNIFWEVDVQFHYE